jgi:dihydroorotate dehydrogenase (NAD+) catalytic subunit
VYEASRAVKIPIVGLGGIEKPEDVLEYMIAGATAVQVGTANFSRPDACESIAEGLRNLCEKYNINGISSLTGSLQTDCS